MSTGRHVADMVLLNGKVSIGIAEAPQYEALAIQRDRILALGTNKEMQEFTDELTTVIDVGGRRIIPGLIDSHIHLVRAGLTWDDELHWDGVSSLEQALAMIADAVKQQPEGTWIRAVGGWHPGQFVEQRGPTQADLNAIAPHHPVYVQLLYEDALVNSAALQACGVTSASNAPAGGLFECDESGELSGRVRGVPAFNYFLQRMGKTTFEQQVASTCSMLQAFNRVGLTGAIDTGGLGATPEIYRPLFEVWRQGKMSVRTRLYVGATERGQEKAQIAEWIRHLAPGFGDALLKVVGVGEIVVFGYHDLEGLVPLHVSAESKRELYEITRMAVEQGWPMQIHAVCAPTISAVLDVWEEIDRQFPLVGRRFSIAHADSITDADLLRVRELGIGLAIQNRLVFRAADSARAWGDDVVHGAPPLRRMLDLGIAVGAGTDATRVTSYNPWLSLWWLVTGCSVDGAPPRKYEHCLSREEALRLYTAGSAWFSFDEQERGTLVPGKLADLAVLSEDYFNVPNEVIPTLQSVLTVVGGRAVYSAL